MKRPKILITANQGKIGLVTETDFKESNNEYMKKYGCPADSKSTIIVRNTMIFSDVLDYQIKEWITGNFQQYHELWTRCRLIQCGGFFVPFSAEFWPIEEQKKIFRPINLNEAYKLIFHGKYQPPDQQPA